MTVQYIKRKDLIVMPIHTFSAELSSMKKQEYWIARDSIFKLCRDDGNRSPACKCHYMTKDQKVICFHFPEHPGINLTLSKRAFPHLEMRINPSIIGGHNYDSLYTFDEGPFIIARPMSIRSSVY